MRLLLRSALCVAICRNCYRRRWRRLGTAECLPARVRRARRSGQTNAMIARNLGVTEGVVSL
jgi:hypothetical protein